MPSHYRSRNPINLPFVEWRTKRRQSLQDAATGLE